MVIAATDAADALINQSPDYRHGMRARGTTLEAGVRDWTTFVDERLAMAVKRVDGPCKEVRRWGLLQLGYGAHAVEDFYSPPHRMQIMEWSRFGEHMEAEIHLAPESGPARQAYAAAREYALLFSWLRRAQVSWEEETIQGIAWGYFGQMLYIDAATAP